MFLEFKFIHPNVASHQSWILNSSTHPKSLASPSISTNQSTLPPSHSNPNSDPQAQVCFQIGYPQTHRLFSILITLLLSSIFSSLPHPSLGFKSFNLLISFSKQTDKQKNLKITLFLLKLFLSIRGFSAISINASFFYQTLTHSFFSLDSLLVYLFFFILF